MKNKIVNVGYGKVSTVKIGAGLPLAFIGGPCAIESRDHAFFMADRIKKICKKVGIKFIYKSCYDKDCRSSSSSFHGVGIDEGLKILQEVRSEFNIPVVADFSDPSWAKPTGEVCDMIQIPAYLCRQTSILRAAAETKRPIRFFTPKTKNISGATSPVLSKYPILPIKKIYPMAKPNSTKIFDGI